MYFSNIASRRIFAKALGVLGCASTLALTQMAHSAVTCRIDQVNPWSTGYTISVTVTNTGPSAINAWSTTVNFSEPANITNSWNVTASGTTIITASNVSHNGSLAVGQSTNFGWQGTHDGSFITPTCGGSATSSTPVSSRPASSVAPSSRPASSVAPSSRPASSVAPSSRPASSVAPSSRPASSRAASSSGPVTANNDDWLSVSGNKIIDRNGKVVWLTGANWFGFNASERVLHGLWSVNMDATLKAITARGINLLRVPISTQLLLEWKAGAAATTGINNFVNPELEGKTSLQIFDAMLASSKKYGLKILLDVHSAEADNSGHVQPLWYKGAFTTQDFYDGWTWVADRYKNDDTIVAYDLKNEPHGLPNAASGFAKWDNSTDLNNWKYAAQEVSRRILAINPNALIMIEGVEAYPMPGKTYASTNPKDYYYNWWGGNLRGVKDFPVTVAGHQNKIMYSPHDYGPLVFNQSWFFPGFNKQTLERDVWNDNWLYIHKQNISPLLIGEWGGLLDNDGPNDTWMKAMRDLLIEYKMHHTFWCINPNSGDTGGLLLNDWVSWDEVKYNLMKTSLWKSGNGKYVGLDHLVDLGGAGVGTNVTAHYASGGAAPVGL
jgi:endoglucanase